MDFRICILLFAALISYSELCELNFDLTWCYYNMVCNGTTRIQDRSWTTFSPNYNRQPHCNGRYTFNGYSMYPIHLIFRDTAEDLITPIPTSYDGGINHAVYSVDLSQNNYGHIPVFQSMENLEILDISKNKLTKAYLSNTREFNKLRQLDLSFNTISSIEVQNEQYAFITLEKINISHNYLQNIPDAVFDKFDRLQTLDFSHNFIEDLNQFTFEGVKNLVYLNLSNNRLAGVGSSLFRFSKLKVLNLSGNRIKDVRVGDFEKLNTLEELDLSSNFIDTIDFNVFHDMLSLHTLDLSNNGLTVINKEVLANLVSLSSIDLSRNKLESLPKGLFRNKTIYTFSITDNLLEGSLAKGMFEGVNVTTLDLSHQLFTEVQDYAFYDLIRLDTLLLNDNEIRSLSTMCFKTLIRLERLDLSNNQIFSIDLNTDDLGSLLALSISNNRLTQIKHERFQHLSNLEYLNLSKNNISRLEPGSFKSLSNLINLGVSGNPLIGTLESDTFDGLASLPSLDISFNLLTTIQNASFNAMNELKDLNMSHSKIKELQYNAFVNTGYVETLDLSYNEIENLFINMTDLVGLGTLLLNNNHLKSLDSTTLQGLLRMSTLNLAYNEIENIHNESFLKLGDLRHLDLSYNEKLNFSDSLLRTLNHLNTLVLSGVKTDYYFSEINDTELFEVSISYANIRNISLLNLRSLKHLNTLVLSSNNVTKLEVGAFSGVSTLSNLDLSFNKIFFIQPGVFKDNTNLMSLNVSHNSLSEIGYGIFRGLNYLNILDMSYNNIKDLKSERFYEVKSLSKLIVDHNRIESISSEEFEGTSLTKLSIGDNPLACHKLVKLMKTGVIFEITAIKLDEHRGENINGITCNKNNDKEPGETNKKEMPISFDKINEKSDVLLDIKNILYNLSNKDSVQVIDDTKYLQNISDAIEKSNTVNEEKLSNLVNISSRVIDSNNKTNMLLQEILKSFHKTNVVTTTPVPVTSDNKSVDVISYVNKMRTELEKSIAVEKQNIINELENKMSMLRHHSDIDSIQTESYSTSPSNEKFVAPNEETKSLFTETCVALILVILVGFVLYKFYKSRMFIRNRLSISTRELPSNMENSAL